MTQKQRYNLKEAYGILVDAIRAMPKLKKEAAAGVLDQRLDGVDVLQAAERARDGFSALVRACLPRL